MPEDRIFLSEQFFRFIVQARKTGENSNCVMKICYMLDLGHTKHCTLNKSSVQFDVQGIKSNFGLKTIAKSVNFLYFAIKYCF